MTTALSSAQMRETVMTDIQSGSALGMLVRTNGSVAYWGSDPRYARSGTRRTSLAAGRRLGWMLVIVAAALLPVLAWGAHVGAQGTETVCTTGLVVESGESCTYPDTTVEFSVDSSGGGRFLIFTSGSSIELKDADINGVIYNFVAKAQRDGTCEHIPGTNSEWPTPEDVDRYYDSF